MLMGLIASLALTSCASQSEFIPTSTKALEQIQSGTHYYAVTTKGGSILLDVGLRGKNLADTIESKLGSTVCFNFSTNIINDGKCKRGIVKRE